MIEISMFSSKISNYLSFSASGDGLYRLWFVMYGLRSVVTNLGDGTIIHCWIPRMAKASKPNLLLIHGFGANAKWQYNNHLRHLTGAFNVYVPDLVFFGGSYTGRVERTEMFQAECMMRMMEAHGVNRMSIVGISYGGFVGYSMAVKYGGMVEKLVLCCTGVCLEEKDMENGLFKVANVEEASSILMPQSPEKLRELIRLSFVNPTAARVPSWFLTDFINVMCKDYVKEKKELIQALLKDRHVSHLAHIRHPTFIIWGDQDQIFPLQLGNRLKRHIGENAQLLVIKNAGHAVNLEKPREYMRHLKSFLLP